MLGNNNYIDDLSIQPNFNNFENSAVVRNQKKSTRLPLTVTASWHTQPNDLYTVSGGFVFFCLSSKQK